MEANETTQNQEEINKTYFMIQSKNPNLTDCQPTILMTELQVSSKSQIATVRNRYHTRYPGA